MALKIDWYTSHARAFPVYMTIAPVPLVLAAMLPHGRDLSLGGAAAVGFVPVAYLVSQLGADFGKRLEKRLWRQWGGAPTTRFLRHSNHEFNQITRERVHEKLRGLGLHVPSWDEQQRDARAADVHYESCTEELIRRTRDGGRFPLVFKGLTEYGFRRNLLGLKPLGLPIAVVALLVCGWSALAGLNAAKPPDVAVGAALLTCGLLLTWLVWVNEKTVSIAANRYARFLLEAALEQQ
ncbi:MAG TPA: hypothetical protein VGK93_09530 [Candidatus Eisenbacteria bacterium]|jgi:hypothetical protein